MAPELESKRANGRKLTKRRKPQRHASIQYPDRLKEGDDVQEDVTAAKGQPAQYANQSVFSVIAAAGSKVDFHSRFDDESSDSDAESRATPIGVSKQKSAFTQSEHAGNGYEDGVENVVQSRQNVHGSSLLRSLPKLNLRTIKEKNYMSQSHLPLHPGQLSTLDAPKAATPRDAPLMSRMLEAEAELNTSTELPSSNSSNSQRKKFSEIDAGHGSLANRLKEIFGFERPEEVISGRLKTVRCIIVAADSILEYPCWLLQSVLLQGYLYITQNHVCFYAYLPKKSVSFCNHLKVPQAHLYQERDREIWLSCQTG